jgi:CDP-diacylglycerol---glycerol-3-phosphate 3-phosphatidyltransferase
MTLANKLTLSRMAVIPVMVLVKEVPFPGASATVMGLGVADGLFALLFVLAALTDLLDGHIARSRNQITTFGKFLDPLADKILVVTALLYLMADMPSRVPAFAVLIVVAREFVVTGIRLLAMGEGKVIAASKLGKAKTAATMGAITIMLFGDFGMPDMIGNVVFIAALVLTVWSGIDYFLKNRTIIFQSV